MNETAEQRILERLASAGLLPITRAAKFRYFQRENGPMFCWTVERLGGKFESMIYKPRGRGARSGKAAEWVLVPSSVRRHAKRKDAKARALRLYEKAAQ